jgi:hypothetical protein
MTGVFCFKSLSLNIFMNVLNEAVKGIQDLLKTHNIIHIGVMGMWDTYYASSPKPGEQPTGKVVQGKPNPLILQKLNSITTEAAQRLGSVGFRSQRAILCIVDQKEMRTNHITGSTGWGGYASRSNHFMVLDLQRIDTEGLVHEHAHMYWFMMSKPAKEIFENWYRKTVNANKEDFAKTQNKLTPEDQNKAKEDFMKRAGSFARSVIETLAMDTHNSSPDHYFNLAAAHESGDEQAMLRRALMTRHSANVYGTLLKPLAVGDTSYGYATQRLEPGEKVKIGYYGGKYIIMWYPPNDKYRSLEHPKSFTDDQMSELVKIDPKSLTPEQKEAYKKNVALAKKPPVSFFASPAMKKKVEEVFTKEFNNFLNNYGHNQMKYSARLSVSGIFSSFMSKLRMRKAKLKTLTDVEDVLIEVMKAKFYAGTIDFADETSKERYGQEKSKVAIQGVSKPEGAGFRDYMHRNSNLPSSYAAANVDELWAETVDFATRNIRGINPELRSMLMKVLSMR